MCGIVGYVGPRDAVEIVVDGLHRLEYRGYDSSGIAVNDDGALKIVKSSGKLAALEEKLGRLRFSGSTAIGHTRWATHGPPTETNAHPHEDTERTLAVVHNGIIENHQSIRRELEEKGARFISDTDSECLAHLIRAHYEGDLFEAVRQALHKVVGAYAIAVVCRDNPDVIVGARKGSPLVVGLGHGEHYFASDAAALLPYTRRVIYMEDDQIAELTREGYRVYDLDGNLQKVNADTVDWDAETAEKSGYPHYMLKEIQEQPEVLENVLRGRALEGQADVDLSELNLDTKYLRSCPRIILVACGTAWHAGLAGKSLIESFAKIPVDVDVASEFRYRDLLIPPGALVIPISQSGETADTLEAMRRAKKMGATVLSLVNVVGSSVVRESDGVLYLRAGLEIGVASTKAYLAMVASLTLLALYLAKLRETLPASELKRLIREMHALPDKVRSSLERESEIEEVAENPRYRDASNALYLARGFNLPNAYEGALKLKEISYIHAEAHAAGEMKHGPIALITPEMPVVCIAPQSATHAKMVSNIQEVRARDGLVLSIGTEGDTELSTLSDTTLFIPDAPEPFSPLLSIVPLQLLAYHIAVNRGCDVDQPRNLAKSVTVE